MGQNAEKEERNAIGKREVEAKMKWRVFVNKSNTHVCANLCDVNSASHTATDLS